MGIALDDEVKLLRGIGPASAQGLLRSGVATVRDLLDFFPRSYNDYSRPLSFSEATGNGEGFFVASVDSSIERYRGKTGVQVLSFRTVDVRGDSAEVTIFNQPYLYARLRRDTRIFFYGKVARNGREFRVISPRVFLSEPKQTYEPVYPAVAGITPSRLRQVIKLALDTVPIVDYHTDAFLKRYKLCGLQEAYRAVHCPASSEDPARGMRRFRVDEHFVMARVLDGVTSRREAQNETPVDGHTLLSEFEARLSFKLTSAQRRAMMEIADDLNGPLCMNRLLQGDVGSGKTVVALYAAYAMVQGGYQAMMLVPTEVLARQHAKTAHDIFPENSVYVLTGQDTSAQRRRTLEEIQTRAHQGFLIIGTHALLYQDLPLSAPALLIADEQHRFGVKQRQRLLSQHASMHSLTMSATPIPRSLALAMHGKTNVSVLDERPPGRKPTSTSYVPRSKIEDMFGFIADRARTGMQAFVVCPVINPADNALTHSAIGTYEYLCGRFPDVDIGLLHGGQNAEDKTATMEAFARGDISVLVATSVIEVGVDVARASVIAVLDADRFGLAQLHQLRGRVGRGEDESYCFLCSDAPTAMQRIRTMCMTDNGFKIAEDDLKERGAGELMGERQHGKSNSLDLLTESHLDILTAVRSELAYIGTRQLYSADFQWFTQKAAERISGLQEIAFN